jgi:CheY-like chemotaxis protein
MARILVVEDNPLNLELSTRILAAAGHHVIPARDAVEAERALGVGPPDLILMDIALPGKDGYTLVRELRHRPPTSHLPILAVSSFAMAGDAEKALAAGFTDYLTKPIRRAVLLERVNTLLGVQAPPSRRVAEAALLADGSRPTNAEVPGDRAGPEPEPAEHGSAAAPAAASGAPPPGDPT